MDKAVCEYKIKGKNKIKECSDRNDISNVNGFINFKKEIHELQEIFNKSIGDIFSKHYEKISNEFDVELLRESFAEKDLKLKPYKYNYSVKFNFFDCLHKEKLSMGFIATKGNVLAELIINIEFE